MSDKTHTHDRRESYSAIVPAKRSNESQGGPQEIVNGCNSVTLHDLSPLNRHPFSD